MQTAKQYDPEKPQFDVLTQINLNAAGIDIGAEKIYIAVPANNKISGRDVKSRGTKKNKKPS